MRFKKRLAYFYPLKREGRMMRLVGGIYAIMFTAIVIAGISSCTRMASTPEVRLEGKFDNYGGMGVKPTYFLTFDEPRFIRRVVIHTDGVVKNIEIYVRVAPEKWRQVKQLMTPLDATAHINMAARGDAIRVVQKSASISGYIQNIEAFGSLK